MFMLCCPGKLGTARNGGARDLDKQGDVCRLEGHELLVRHEVLASVSKIHNISRDKKYWDDEGRYSSDPSCAIVRSNAMIRKWKYHFLKNIPMILS